MMWLNKKKSITTLLLLLFISALFPGLATAEVIPVIQDDQVTITGDNARASQWVNISVVREDGKRAYIGQVRSDAAGVYQFNFRLDKGRYNYFLSTAKSQGNLIVEPSNIGDGLTPVKQKGTAYLTIQGDTAKGTILPYTSWKWNCQTCSVINLLTEILDSNGIPYDIRGAYVKSIDGLAEKMPGYPMSGWLYSVNGKFPSVGADSYLLKDGDRVEWIYSLDGRQGMNIQEVKLSVPDEIKQLVDSYAKQLSDLKESRLLNLEKRMSDEEATQLHKGLMANIVSISQQINNEKAEIADSTGEVALLIPTNAVTRSMILNIQEENGPPEKNRGIRLCSSIYNFEPDGARFASPVTVVIKAGIFSDMDVNNLMPAWYDEQKDEWVPIPALLDLKNGLVVFQIDHFTRFALIEIKPQEEEIIPAEEMIFIDIGEEFSWARQSIDNLAARGIVKGSGYNCFEPQRAISRAEFIQLLATAMQLEDETKHELSFTDVSSDDWFADALNKAYRKGLISGYPDKTLRPGNSINRYEIALLLHRFDEQAPPKQPAQFSDREQIPDWALKAVAYAGEQRLIQGYEDGSYRGTRSLNRAEAACIIYRLLIRTDEA